MDAKSEAAYQCLNNEGSDSRPLVAGLNEYHANLWMNFAMTVVRLDHRKVWIGMQLLFAWWYGGFAVCWVLATHFIYTIWSFQLPASCPHDMASTSLDVLIGRSWKVSEQDPVLHSNNNISITLFNGRYLAAFRNASRHWPSADASLVVASADHPAGPWTVEWQYKTGEDLREMLLFELKGTLFLFYCSISSQFLGTFNVEGTRCFTSKDGKSWQTPPGNKNKLASREGELIWDVKVTQNAAGESVAYKTSYIGGHYQSTGNSMSVLFEQSDDGFHWLPCGSSKDGVVYVGGISEVAFEFTKRGDLVAIGRNEDGDSTGFGSQLFFAPASDLGAWRPLKVSLPWRFDSPRMTRVEASGDILLFARYTYHRFDCAPGWLPLKLRQHLNIFMYSVQPKTAAIYQIMDPAEWAGSETPWTTCSPLKLVRFFEHGHASSDTGFFSLVPHPSIGDSWFVANYTATATYSHAWWVYGQLTPSDVYVAEVRAEQNCAKVSCGRV